MGWVGNERAVLEDANLFGQRERRIGREGMVNVGGNFYSVPDATTRRVVEVHTSGPTGTEPVAAAAALPAPRRKLR